MAGRFNMRVVAMVLALWLALPAMAWASSFEFAGTSDNKGVHLHSQGRINFQWVPVTGSSPSGDPVTNFYWGANDLGVFDAIGRPFGTYSLQVGDSFTGLNYELPMWLDANNLPNINSQDQTAAYNSWNLAGTMRITSISFPSQYEIVIGGQLTEVVNRVLGSTVLDDLVQSPAINFNINVVWNSRTAMDFVTALNSGGLSTFANIEGSMTSGPGGGGGVVPEPGTLGLLASALGTGGLLLRRRDWLKPPTS